MTPLAGTWSDRKTAGTVAAELVIGPGLTCEVRRAGQRQPIYSGSLHAVRISSRLGATARTLELPDGSVFETRDNDALDHALNAIGFTRQDGMLHSLENNWPTALVMMVLVVVTAFGFYRYGIPATAKLLAAQIPQEWIAFTDKEFLEYFDERMDPSELADDEQEHWRSLLQSYAGGAEADTGIRFWSGGYGFGANAFALPGGTIVFTDELIQLAGTPEQVIAVYGHELGHLHHRHHLRRIIQGSMLAFAIAILTGSATATSDLLMSSLAIFSELQYSRDFEREADDFALEFLERHAIPSSHFADMFKRMECNQIAAEEDMEQCLRDEAWREQFGEDHWSSYLYTHPPTKERIRRIEQGRVRAR